MADRSSDGPIYPWAQPPALHARQKAGQGAKGAEAARKTSILARSQPMGPAASRALKDSSRPLSAIPGHADGWSGRPGSGHSDMPVEPLIYAFLLQLGRARRSFTHR